MTGECDDEFYVHVKLNGVKIPGGSQSLVNHSLFMQETYRPGKKTGFVEIETFHFQISVPVVSAVLFPNCCT